MRDKYEQEVAQHLNAMNGSMDALEGDLKRLTKFIESSAANAAEQGEEGVKVQKEMISQLSRVYRSAEAGDLEALLKQARDGR